MYHKISNFKVTLHTTGNGYWSDKQKIIHHSRAEVYPFSFEEDGIERCTFGELRVYFPKKCWNIEKDGLIYTDSKWLKELRKYLRSIGFSEKASRDVDYSEQGMQGNNYVSLDVGTIFLRAFLKGKN